MKTIDVLKLKEYKVNFPTFPKLPDPFRPFESWEPGQPTQSLDFYLAYNETKHNREGGLEHATFKNVLSSYAALTIVAFATCGPEIAKAQRLQNFVSLEAPNWKIDDHYIPTFQAYGSRGDQNGTWSEENYPQFP